MQIAVASQNCKTVTPHAGKCTNFWLYQIDCGNITRRSLLALRADESLHASHGVTPNPLDSADVLIAGSMGDGLFRRLQRQNIRPIVTSETDPDIAVVKYLMG